MPRPKRGTPTSSQSDHSHRVASLERRIAAMEGSELKASRRFLEKTLAGLKASGRSVRA